MIAVFLGDQVTGASAGLPSVCDRRVSLNGASSASAEMGMMASRRPGRKLACCRFIGWSWSRDGHGRRGDRAMIAGKSPEKQGRLPLPGVPGADPEVIDSGKMGFPRDEPSLPA